MECTQTFKFKMKLACKTHKLSDTNHYNKLCKFTPSTVNRQRSPKGTTTINKTGNEPYRNIPVKHINSA